MLDQIRAILREFSLTDELFWKPITSERYVSHLPRRFGLLRREILAIEAIRRWTNRRSATNNIQLIIIANKIAGDDLSLKDAYEMILSLAHDKPSDEIWRYLDKIIDDLTAMKPIDPVLTAEDSILQYVWTSRTGSTENILLMTEDRRNLLYADLQMELKSDAWESGLENDLNAKELIDSLMACLEPHRPINIQHEYLLLTEKETYEKRLAIARQRNTESTTQAKSILQYTNMHRAESSEASWDYSAFLPYPSVHKLDCSSLRPMPMAVAKVILEDYENLSPSLKGIIDTEIAAISVMAGLIV